MSFITFVSLSIAYAPMTLDLDLLSESHHASFLSADVGKTIDHVLTTHLLQTVIKLIFVANFGLFR